MTNLKTALIATLAFMAFGASPSLAQKAPAKSATTVKVAKAAPSKKVIKKSTVKRRRSAASLACSAKADKQGLKGKSRKVFRAKCLRSAKKAAAKQATVKKSAAKKTTPAKTAKKKN